MRDGPAAGLVLIEAILDRGDLRDYRPAHAARAELCRRLGRTADARVSFKRALALAQQEPERRFLERRLAELPSHANGAGHGAPASERVGESEGRRPLAHSPTGVSSFLWIGPIWTDGRSQ